MKYDNVLYEFGNINVPVDKINVGIHMFYYNIFTFLFSDMIFYYRRGFEN